jgi:hypothetical protein
MSKTIAILFYEREKHYRFDNYNISDMAKIWRDDGHSVKLLYGIKKFIPADICFVHVDLSVVPDAYIEFANRYPIVINGKIKNILKSKISRNLVTKDEKYQGSVIVKTDLNHAGWPEKLSAFSTPRIVLTQLARRLGQRSQKIKSQLDYKIYQDSSEVPERYFSDPNYVVEKFLPEKHGELYCVNCYRFLGNCHQGIKIFSRDPLVLGVDSVKREYVPPHPEILEIRDQLKMDYGKMDYCIVNNHAVLLDANKTIGVTRDTRDIVTKQYYDFIRQQAKELYNYF